MDIREVELDHAFAETAQTQHSFQAWLLSRGRFARPQQGAVLLVDEQRSARPTTTHWWKHWWCQLPDGTQSETDIFMVFEADNLRFALHIENKPTHGSLSMRQAADHRRRAALMANDDRWLGYSDFEALLLAPRKFIESNFACANQFDRHLSYEDVGAFAPLFIQAACS